VSGPGTDDVDLSDLGPDVGPMARRAELHLRRIEAARRRERAAEAAPDHAGALSDPPAPEPEPEPVADPATGSARPDVDARDPHEVLRRLEEAAARLRESTPPPED